MAQIAEPMTGRKVRRRRAVYWDPGGSRMEVGRKTCKRCEVQVHTESEEDLKKGHVAKKARRRTEDEKT